MGVTWTDPNARIDGTIQVRTRDLGTGRWTGWRTLEADGTAAGDRRGSTDPLWVGRSNGVEARIAGDRGALPAGLRVDLINPDAERPSGRIESAPAMTSAPMPARPVPRMVTRAGWGANETIVRSAPAYTGPVQVFFVHHTATGNGYSCRDSAAIVRGIQAYQIRIKGWDDIGYNFLVDKCGTIFEGRGGGVGRNVLGAHTLGFNTDASAVAVIGTYDAVGVSPAVRTAIATVAAYKLGAAGNPPNGKVVYTSGGGDRYPLGRRVTMYRISGHRDAGRTDCPGDSLYRQLPQIRAIAGAAPIGLRLLRVPGAVKLGPLLYTRGAIRPLWTVATPSALIARFEIWVDGKLAIAAPGSHRTTALRLAPGGHTVAVRAVHLSGRAVTTAVRVVSDAKAPVFTYGPDVALRTGSLDGSVPIRLGWRATDVNGLSAVRLLRPASINLGVATRSRTGTVKPAVPATFGLRATDRAGNAVSASVTRTPIVVSEGVARRTGIWHALRNPRHLGGVALGSTTAGSTASWTFTGRSAALAVSRATGSGRMRIRVDGADQGAIDLRAPRTRYREAVWTRYWSSSGTHTVRISVERPGVVLDGLVFLK
ncbi:N-acetylmuramoyl-L-alanine amidase [Actinoplanes sp. CA-030573]|uniref:N-acetylmuramoyl-L-alanine amidase n=1 Tax=Actinoplanes sp. CA-030573 TaxID=3239898 RepID=UPI003D8E55CE